MLVGDATPAAGPGEHSIKSRKLRAKPGRFGNKRRYWLNGDPVATAVYNGLSLNFPKAEVFFIESVNAYRSKASGKLAREIRVFTRQEAMHTKEHAALNKHISAAGFDIGNIDRRSDMIAARARGWSPVAKLTSTMILEHITAIGSKQLLANTAHLGGADEEVAALWRWHALEEIEHKGVAHDVWLLATEDWPGWKRWILKAGMTVFVTAGFCKQRWLDSLYLLGQDGHSGPRAWARLLWFLFGKPGMVRKLFLPWLLLLRPGFHPWQNDDRSLIRLADSQYGDAILPE